MKKTLLAAILGLAASGAANAQGHLRISNYMTPPYNQVVYSLLDPLPLGGAVNDTDITFQIFYGKGDDPANCINPGTTFHVSDVWWAAAYDPGVGRGPGGFFFVTQIFPDWQPGDVYTLMYKVVDPEMPDAQSIYWQESRQITSTGEPVLEAAMVPGLAFIIPEPSVPTLAGFGVVLLFARGALRIFQAEN